MTEEQLRKRSVQEVRERFLASILALVALGGLISFTLWYTAYRQHVADQRWCELVIGIDDRQQAIRNPSPEQAEFAARIHRLRQELHCGPLAPAPTTPKGTPSWTSPSGSATASPS